MKKVARKQKKTHGGSRAGAGRPVKFPDASYLTVRCPGRLLERIDAECGEHRTRSDVVIGVLLNHYYGLSLAELPPEA